MQRRNFISPYLLLCLLFSAQAPQAQEIAKVKTAFESILPDKKPYYLDFTQFDPHLFVVNPPDTATTQAELAELHRIQDARTPEQVEHARHDEEQENIFLFQTLLGASFTAKNFPITAELSGHLKNEQSVVGTRLKTFFNRPRPYQADPTLHPVCVTKTAHDSYPSGHALTGYLEALALAEMLPDKHDAILARADDYAHNRLICGVHYSSDLEASRRIAYAIYGYILSTPQFQRDLSSAHAELVQKMDAPAR
jgi:acid phosphatase (class A)